MSTALKIKPDLVTSEIAKCSVCKDSLTVLIPEWVAEDLGSNDASEVISAEIYDRGWRNYPSNTDRLVCKECLEDEKQENV